jgi:hypothetical protein
MPVELTDAQRRFLLRVAKITHAPWSGKVEAFDGKGKKMRLAVSTFELLKGDNLIIRSESSITTDTYVVQPPAILPDDVIKTG